MGDEVSVNYRGTLIDGTEFDASARRGQPLNIKVMSGPSGVIKGWIEALQLMKTGSKWKIFVPADLAYGSQARPPQIAPNSVLIFELELLSIKPAPSANAGRPAMAAAVPVTVSPAGVTATPVAPAAPAAPAAPVVPVAPTPPPAPLTSDIIRVPSAEEMKKGAKIETIKPEDLEKEKAAVKP
jgi:FKBP-type peptidyl-prolyl cis-trans isomerase FklB